MTTTQSPHFVSWRIWIFGMLLMTATSGIAQQQLPPTEARTLLSNHTIFGISENGSRFHVYHSPDGKTFGESRGQYYDMGIWSIADDGKYCRQWNKWRDGTRDCFNMYVLGDGKYRFLSIDKNYDSTFQILEGDPHRLRTKARN